MSRPHIEPYCELNEAYERFEIPGFRGSHHKVLSLDTDNGASSLKVRFDGGFKRKPGISYSDQEIFVLSGELRVGKEVWQKGHYAFVPAGVALPAITTTSGAEALVMFNDGVPSFEEADGNHRLALTGAYRSVNTYLDLPWASGAVTYPAASNGCLVKILHFDPLTEAMTFLYSMTAQYVQDNVSYHDCVEESYHIWGDSWMQQFGDLPTGGYFWRPPYINHGPFRSECGVLALARVTSKLYNYFHYNPWTVPEENRHRAAAMLYRQRPELADWMGASAAGFQQGPPDFEHRDYHCDHQVKMLHGADQHEHHSCPASIANRIREQQRQVPAALARKAAGD